MSDGPTPEFWDRFSRATNAPVIMGLDPAAGRALNERMLAAGTFEAMSETDQRLIEQAEYEISAGLSPTLQHPDDWAAGSDWAAEEAELGLEPAPPPEAELKALELPAADDDGWVGM